MYIYHVMNCSPISKSHPRDIRQSSGDSGDIRWMQDGFISIDDTVTEKPGETSHSSAAATTTPIYYPDRAPLELMDRFRHRDTWI